MKIDYAGVFHIPSYDKRTHIEYVSERKQNAIEGKMGNQLRFKMKRSKKMKHGIETWTEKKYNKALLSPSAKALISNGHMHLTIITH